MNDWIHCNKCSLKYTANIKLFLSECGHIFCQRCAEQLKESKCIICDKSTSIIEFCKDMDLAVQQFFIPYETYLKKALEIYNFQMQHRVRLTYMLMKKYECAKRECVSCHNKNKNLMREIKMLKTMLMSMGQNPQPFLTSTPALTSDMSQADTMSMLSSVGYTPTPHRPRPGYGQRILPGGYVPMRTPQYQSHFNGAPARRPSPAQMVPSMARRVNMPPVHGPPGTANSMEQLRGAAKRT